MSDSNFVDFGASAKLKKWPSIAGKPALHLKWSQPYLLVEGSLDECIRKFMTFPGNQRHLYEIHTEPQPDIVSAVMTAEHIVELGRLRDYL